MSAYSGSPTPGIHSTVTAIRSFPPAVFQRNRSAERNSQLN
jgi:hypothetical protein